MTSGLVAGRFLPPHAGHRLLIDTASQLVDRLFILLLTKADDPIPPAARLAWLQDLFPAATIRVADVADPAAAIDAPIDRVFAGDARAAGLAQALGARLVLIDPEHEVIGETSALADPTGPWQAAAPAVEPRLARSICLHGPESTGKSTLAPKLAEALATIHVPEYGRTYCEQFGLDLTMADLVEIGRTQAAIGAAALRLCNRRLILDTDPLMTAAWAEMLFQRTDPWFDAFEATADLYLLLDIDMPWIDDGTRFFGEAERRRRFFDLSRDQLERRGLAYRIIGGPPEERFERALAAIADAGL